MTRELKPCPFCGGEPTFEAYDRLYSISCHKCGYSRGFHGLITTVPHGKPISKETSRVVEYYNPNARDEAIAAWNTRAERTCTMIQKPTIDPYIDTLTCNKCNHTMLFAVLGEKMPKHCPNCEAKVMNE